jgi:hypothetical protein
VNVWEYPVLIVVTGTALLTLGKGALWFYRLSKGLEEGVQYLRHEMELNSGKTMRDAIDRIEERQLAIEEALQVRQSEEDARWRHHLNALEDTP